MGTVQMFIFSARNFHSRRIDLYGTKKWHRKWHQKMHGGIVFMAPVSGACIAGISDNSGALEVYYKDVLQ